VAQEQYAEISCLEQWLESKGWSLDLHGAEQNRLEAEFVGEYANVRAALWERHYRSLDATERARLDSETHPSYSWDLAAEAKPYLEELRSKVTGTGFVKDVTMDCYHGNTIVFTVRLSRDMHWREYRKAVPEFYRGFQVFVAAAGGEP
jgi:hypothetical protein